jgi:fructokinase
MDVFENGQATVGGAPFNVTFHLHQLLTSLSLGEAVFFSAVGRDEWGRQIRSVAVSAGMMADCICEVDHPTGSALVFEHEGGAGFEIQPDVAWDCIQLNDEAFRLARCANAAVFGSLAQRSEVSRNSIRQLVASVKGHRLYDVNLRRNTTNGVAGYSGEIITSSLEMATLVKMNEVELEEVALLLGFTPESTDPQERTLQFMKRLRTEYSLTAVAITRGAKGALLASEGKQLGLPDSKMDQALVHPVGAGDSFAAGLLFGIMQGWTPDDSLELANILSSWVVQNTSATPPLPEGVLAEVRGLAARAGMTPELPV